MHACSQSVAPALTHQTHTLPTPSSGRSPNHSPTFRSVCTAHTQCRPALSWLVVSCAQRRTLSSREGGGAEGWAGAQLLLPLLPLLLAKMPSVSSANSLLRAWGGVGGGGGGHTRGEGCKVCALSRPSTAL